MDTRGFNEGDITSHLDDIKNAIAATTSQELPAVTAEDNGKILKVVNGDWNKAVVTPELPEVSGSDNGKVLGVVEGEWAKTDAPTELPSVTSTDNGKILGVVEGIWAKTDAPSSSNRVIVTYSYSEEIPVASKSSIEILDDFNAGKEIYFNASNLEGEDLDSNVYSVYGSTTLHFLNVMIDSQDQEITAYFWGYVHGKCIGEDAYYILLLGVNAAKSLYFKYISTDI